MTILHKAIYRFNAIHMKIPMAFFSELEQIALKFAWKHQRSWVAKTISRNNRARVTMLPNLMLYCKDIIIKTAWYWHKDRYIDQWNKIKSTEINSLTHDQLICDKGGKNMQWRKYSLFSKEYWPNRTATCKPMKLEHCNIIYKNKLKMIKDLKLSDIIYKCLIHIIHTMKDLQLSSLRITITKYITL